MRTNKEIADRLNTIRKQIILVAKRIEQEGGDSQYSENIKEYSLHDSLTGLVAKKIELEWVLKINHK